uniref:Galactose oxidase n=1 Tax=Rhabditophanes sp. KR3021 TaxID=114890 RepID=A0AC35TWL0_9BILA
MAWYTEKSMNTGLINHESVVTDNQVVYVTPGSKFNKIQRYDPRDIRSWSVLSPIPTNTLRSAVTLINNTEILMIGGFFKTDNANTCQVFDIRSSRWRTFPSIPQKLSSSKAAEIGDKIYLFGGQLDKESFTSEVYSYNKFNPIQKWEIVEGIELTAANGFFSKVVF